MGKDSAQLRFVEDSEGRVKAVQLPNGYEIPADLVLVGAGADIDCSLA